MGNSESKPPEGVSRTKLGVIGVDVVSLSTPETIATALSSGDLKRMQEVSPDDLSQLPWFMQRFFGVSRFINTAVPKGYFLALRGSQDPAYEPCRKYLDDHFASRRSFSDLAAKTAAAIADPANQADDRTLSDLCIKAVWRQVVPEGHPDIPEDVLTGVRKQINDIGDSFNPFARHAAKAPTARVYAYTDEVLQSLGDRDRLPDACVTDVAHIFFATGKNAPTLLRELADHPNDDIVDIFSRINLTRDVPRMTVRDSTLGGLLSGSKPAYAKKTLILLNIGSAAQATKDIAYSFSAGPGERRCCAQAVLLDFFKEVQQELRKIKP